MVRPGRRENWSESAGSSRAQLVLDTPRPGPAAGAQRQPQVTDDNTAWSQRIVWGDRLVWGDAALAAGATSSVAGNRLVWGDQLVWGDRLVWGDSTVWGTRVVWADRVVWGAQTASTSTDGTRIVWGDLAKVLGNALSGLSWVTCYIEP